MYAYSTSMVKIVHYSFSDTRLLFGSDRPPLSEILSMQPKASETKPMATRTTSSRRPPITASSQQHQDDDEASATSSRSH